jgi:phenylpropionate dioxygenase-like ring-hydroxylating dioxygenase large terminal subunit
MDQLTNDTLTQTGPGTPMGDLFRSYWLPVALVSDVPTPDCAPVRVKILGERLIVFRDTHGDLGLIDEFCPHRRASLFYGRNEQCGLRCGYHGWKFDTNGNCLEVPAERDNTAFKDRIKIKSYPVVELGRAIWAYMGPEHKTPPLPGWDVCKLPINQTYMSRSVQECNWLQALEGNIDPEHVLYLHRGDLFAEPHFDGIGDHNPVYDVRETGFGIVNGVRRNAANDQYYWRVNPWVLPCYIGVAVRYGGPVHGRFWIPMDDENTMVWSTDHHPTRAFTESEVAGFNRSIHVKNIPGTDRPVANKDNEYLLDRDNQRAGYTATGIQTIQLQDRSLQESMGRIVDRTREHLCSSDNAIIIARKKLLKAIADVQADIEPAGVDPANHMTFQMQLLLDRDVDYWDETQRLLGVGDYGILPG